MNEASEMVPTEADITEGEATEGVTEKVVLPEGWVEYLDEASGAPYYYNTVTAEQVWELPTESANVNPEQDENGLKPYSIDM